MAGVTGNPVRATNERLHRGRQRTWYEECAGVDPDRLRVELSVAQARARGLTPEERRRIKLAISEAKKRERKLDDRVLRGIRAQQERDEQLQRLAGY